MQKPLFRFMLVASFLGILFYPVLSANATTSTFTLNFKTGDLTFEKSQGFDKVSLKDGSFLSSVGEPYLPVKFVQIAIPRDLEVQAVGVNWEMRQELEGRYSIYPTQREYPLRDKPWKDQIHLFTEPDPKVYNLTKEYPGELVEILGHGFLAGQHIVDLVICPLQYVPSEGRLIFYTQIEFSLDFAPSTSQPVPVKSRSERAAAFYNAWVRSFVLNAEDVNFENLGKDKQEEVEYLIITDTDFVAAFQPLADWKTQKGVPAEIVTLQWINSYYTGDDEQDRIRNCITDFYDNHGTIWVLLGGDTDLLPHRLVYCHTSGAGNYPWEDDIPCDLYYSCLDGNWNSDGDGVYGEFSDNVDLYPEVIVGRAPAGYLDYANTFVSKSLTYQTNPTTDYMTRMLLAGENLDASTDGCILKTWIYNYIVWPCFPDTTVLCQSRGNLDYNSFRDALNQGQNIINHDGHGDVGFISIGDDIWYTSAMDGLENGSQLGLFYSNACLANCFDFDCVGEHWINNPDGGGYAFVGNSRYGWYLPGYPLAGSSADFDKGFFRQLCDSNNYHQGKTLSDCKINFVPQAQQPSKWSYRWVMYTLNLLGDPELPIFTTTPSALSVSHPETVSMEPQTVDVYVEVEGSPEEGALVCLSKAGEVCASGFTMLDGWVHLSIDPFASGDMLVTVTAQNCIPYQGTMNIPPVLFLDEFTFDDTEGGNGNGRPEGDETVKLYFTIRSDWKPLEETFVTASVDHPDIVFYDDYSYLGYLPSGGSVNNDADPMEFYVMPDMPATVVHFTLRVVGNGGEDSTWLVKEAWSGKSDILLVDDDQGTGKFSNYEDYYTAALDSLKACYDIWDKMNQPDTIYNFSDYELLIWFTGDHRDSVFSNADIESLMTFLDNGGRLFLTSQDAAEALSESGDPSDSIFLTDYLHCGLFDDNLSKHQVMGVPGDTIGDGFFIYLWGIESPKNQVSKDALVPDESAVTSLNYANAGWIPAADTVAGLRYQGDFYKLVFFGFGFEGLNTSEEPFQGEYLSRPHFVMQRVIEWLEGPLPAVNVIYPNGREDTLGIGNTHNILWECISFEGSVKIEYSVNAGDEWSTIVETTTCDGVFLWTVPDTLTPSDSCLIRISDVDNGIPCDTSDSYFSIIRPSIDVTYPNGGDTLVTGFTSNILWECIFQEDSVKIEYSTNAGSTWSTIETTTCDGVHPWTVSDTLTPSDSCLIRISDVGNGIPCDTSDNYFCIISYVYGDANGDRIVDIGDVVHLINYLFTGTSPPEPMAAGDPNADCVVDVGDVIYLINYLFTGTSAPKQGCA